MKRALQVYHSSIGFKEENMPEKLNQSLGFTESKNGENV